MMPRCRALLLLVLLLCAGCAAAGDRARPEAPARVEVEVAAGRALSPLPAEDPPRRAGLAPLEELLNPAEAGVTPEALAAALEGLVPPNDELAGPVRLVHAHWWRPEHGRELVVWAACRGESGEDTAACALAVGKIVQGDAVRGRGAGLRVLASEAAGWRAPDVDLGESRAELVLSGEDGEGYWQQSVTLSRGGGRAVRLGEPIYAEPDCSE